MRSGARLAPSAWLLMTGLCEAQAPGSKPAGDAPRLEMTPAVVCRRVDGYEKYEPLPGPSLTSEDKLKVYFRPLNFRIEPYKATYRAKFSEDGRLRRKGEKAPIAKEDKLLEYEARLNFADEQVYLVNTIGLKGMKPGEYELDITLRDDLVEGSSATQTVAFTIVPTPTPPPTPPSTDADANAEGTAGPAAPPDEAKSKPRAKSRSKARPRAKGKADPDGPTG